MKKKLFLIVSVFVALITIFSGVIFFKISQISSDIRNSEQVVALNEIQKLSEEVVKNPQSIEKLNTSIENLQNDIKNNSYDKFIKKSKTTIIIVYLFCVLFVFIVFGYIYFSILKPFDKMKAFANEIANGNFDIPLNYERSNYFGAYTWAFDHMRKEIIKARACEKEAIINNKTVIATLSHDIKTPIASIRAYAEGLEASLDTDIEKRNRYISVITRKCDEVTKLTNDIFLHSLSDLDKLKMNLEKADIKEVLEKTIADMAEKTDIIKIKNQIPQKELIIDIKRFEQVLENLINNARKYAESNVEISCELLKESYVIHIRDFGKGIPDEDMPFIFEKFYRGKNVGKKEGSGLGLYIVKYIMEQHGGDISLINHSDGLEAVLTLPLK